MDWFEVSARPKTGYEENLQQAPAHLGSILKAWAQRGLKNGLATPLIFLSFLD
jgi:hypothetical protein